jgi:hypothetical protein
MRQWRFQRADEQVCFPAAIFHRTCHAKGKKLAVFAHHVRRRAKNINTKRTFDTNWVAALGANVDGLEKESRTMPAWLSATYKNR